MYKKIIINIVLILAVVLFQISFINGLPGWLHMLDLVLVISVFILGLNDLKTALWWILGSGFFLDILSFSPFGSYLISLSLAIIIANFLLVNFFTNRSMYSFLAISFLFTVTFNLLFYLVSHVITLIGGIEFNAILDIYSLGRQLIMNLAASWLIFSLFNFVSNKLKPVFLTKHKI